MTRPYSEYRTFEYHRRLFKLFALFELFVSIATKFIAFGLFGLFVLTWIIALIQIICWHIGLQPLDLGCCTSRIRESTAPAANTGSIGGQHHRKASSGAGWQHRNHSVWHGSKLSGCAWRQPPGRGRWMPAVVCQLMGAWLVPRHLIKAAFPHGVEGKPASCLQKSSCD